MRPPKITAQHRAPKCHVHYRAELASALNVLPGGKARIRVAHDPTGDLTGIMLTVSELSYDLAAQVYERGTTFELGTRRAMFDGARVVRS